MTQKDEIHKMMDYLKLSEYTLVEGQTYWLGRTRTTYTKDNKWTRTEDGLGKYWDESTEQNYLRKIHKKLVELCKEKAIQKWADIELANRGLFWCTYED